MCFQLIGAGLWLPKIHIAVHFNTRPPGHGKLQNYTTKLHRLGFPRRLDSRGNDSTRPQIHSIYVYDAPAEHEPRQSRAPPSAGVGESLPPVTATVTKT